MAAASRLLCRAGVHRAVRYATVDLLSFTPSGVSFRVSAEETRCERCDTPLDRRRRPRRTVYLDPVNGALQVGP